MELSKHEICVLRELAQKVLEISGHPVQKDLKRLWTLHNSLKQERVMILCYPEDSWEEIVPPVALLSESPLARTYEWHMRHLIYRWENIGDDFPIEPVVKVPLQYKNTGWGLQAKREVSLYKKPEGPKGMATPFSMCGEFCRVFEGRPDGAYHMIPVLLEESDLEKFTYPEIIVDEEATARMYEILSAAIGDILQVKIDRQVDFNLSLIGTLNGLRGMQQVMLDLYDRPEWFHKVMEFMTKGMHNLIRDCEKRGLIELNNGNHYVGSGGVGYTDELPKSGCDGTARLADCWGHATMQSATYMSPSMQDEFVLQYQARLLKEYGLSCFGCCEVLNRENIAHIEKRVKNLRRVSVSPFTDIALAAEELGDRYIFSWKHNPAQFPGDGTDEEGLAAFVKRGLHIAGKCNMEIILKDIISVKGQPGGLKKWVQTVRRVTESK